MKFLILSVGVLMCMCLQSIKAENTEHVDLNTPSLKDDDIDALTRSVENLIDNTEKSKYEIFQHVESTLQNANKKIIDELDHLLENTTGIIANEIKKVSHQINDFVEKVNKKAVEAIEVPVNLSAEAYYAALRTSLKAQVLVVSALNKCSNNKGLKTQSLQRLANCTPTSTIDQKDIDTLLYQIDGYVTYITKTPERVLECINEGFGKKLLCLGIVNKEIFVESVKLNLEMVKDGVDLAKYYTDLTTSSGVCYTSAGFNIMKDYALAGVDVKACLGRK